MISELTNSSPREFDPEEEIRQLRATLRKMQRENAALSLRNTELEKALRRAGRTVEDAWEQIDVLRHSSSWQMTAPIRALKMQIRGILK